MEKILLCILYVYMYLKNVTKKVACYRGSQNNLSQKDFSLFLGLNIFLVHVV